MAPGQIEARGGACVHRRALGETAAPTPLCPVPRCHAGMLRDPNGRDEVSCPVCDGTLTREEYLAAPEGKDAPAPADESAADPGGDR